MTETTGTDDDRRFPPALTEVARTEFPYEDDHSIDFEPYEAFASAGTTTDWFRHWTGNHELDGSAYRVFGQDGTGGLAALWLARPGLPLVDQPVVFMGSEGQNGVVAGSLSDFLWVLADGLGPCEVVVLEDDTSYPDTALPALAEIAARHATTPRRPAREIIAEAQAEFPTFDEDLEKLCR
ncbi:SMI1/KNR4 family protein [Streptomyces sp. NBC_01102]|uniref:SMI1/KNR4 family protein n=1 Tax=unclassified Streptomyces TaxID=2593676 RepID=UPI0038652171|nr:SMI1/KNR4 family protein [Streptomyces sp. NBC_01102]